MFDMGFTEMMLIGIVALVVIGPERLPGVARTAGKYVGRLKRFMTSVKADVEQELRADELRQILSQQQKELDSLKDTISEAGRDIERQADVSEALAEPPTTTSAPEPVEPGDTTPPEAQAAGEVQESPPSTPAKASKKASKKASSKASP
jgi:sec-independent protein translocase protein TatB